MDNKNSDHLPRRHFHHCMRTTREVFLNEDDNIINDETDLENNALQTQTTLKQQLTTLQTKHAIDTQSLLGVEGLHKNLIVQIEVLRRRIRELETKQDDIARRKEECRDFLIAASAEFT